MKASSFKYLVKEGGKNVWLNRLMSFASVGVLTTCLLLIGFSWLLSANINNMVTSIGDQNEVVFFIRDDASEEEIHANLAALESDSRLFEVEYIDKERALEEYKETMGESAILLEGLEGEENPCPASFRFKIVDLSQTSAIVSELESNPIKEKINAPTDVADTITNIKDMINVFAIVLIVALVVVSLVIIANTIRASVFSRRKEINIMKYVGATNNFIRIPFFVEGVVIGTISAVLAFFLIWGVYELLFSYMIDNASVWLQDLLSSVIPFHQIAWELVGCFLGAGIIVGTVGCTFSVRNHLKV
ncbi:MAG: permease-like cell division protein FtsX [Oscillospiraceae bacterium]|jgi:cell division transport system permease protein